MQMEINPFISVGYISKEYFCDREYEMKLFENYLQNNINITLISPRRIGKTSFIHRFFEEMKEKNIAKCIYIDIYSTQNLKDFTEKTVNEVFRAFPQKKRNR